MSDIITVRVDRSTKEKIKKHKIIISDVVRNAIKEEILRREEEELAEKVRAMKHILRKIPDKELVKMVRESRDQR